MTDPKPAVFLITIQIRADSAEKARRFARDAAHAVEATYLRDLYHAARGVQYELNLTKWEPIK